MPQPELTEKHEIGGMTDATGNPVRGGDPCHGKIKLGHRPARVLAGVLLGCFQS